MWVKNALRGRTFNELSPPFHRTEPATLAPEPHDRAVSRLAPRPSNHDFTALNSKTATDIMRNDFHAWLDFNAIQANGLLAFLMRHHFDHRLPNWSKNAHSNGAPHLAPRLPRETASQSS